MINICQDVIAEGGFAIVFLVKTSHGTRLALKRYKREKNPLLFLFLKLFMLNFSAGCA